MRMIAVYLTDADSTDVPVAAFPAPLTDETRSRINEFLARVHPGRPFNLREEDVQLGEPSKPQ